MSEEDGSSSSSCRGATTTTTTADKTIAANDNDNEKSALHDNIERGWVHLVSGTALLVVKYEIPWRCRLLFRSRFLGDERPVL
jgi:hypothetical protein